MTRYSRFIVIEVVALEEDHTASTRRVARKERRKKGWLQFEEARLLEQQPGRA